MRKFGEFGIVPDQQYLFVGQVERDNGVCFMKPKFILGENKDLFMQFLDKQIMDTSKKAMRAFGVGLIFFLGHFIYFRIIARQNLFKDIKEPVQQLPPTTINQVTTENKQIEENKIIGEKK